MMTVETEVEAFMFMSFQVKKVSSISPAIPTPEKYEDRVKQFCMLIFAVRSTEYIFCEIGARLRQIAQPGWKFQDLSVNIRNIAAQIALEEHFVRTFAHTVGSY